MRRVIACLNPNTSVGNSARSRKRFNCLLLGLATLALKALAAPLENKEWLACDKNADCTSVVVGCYQWVPASKEHAAEVQQQGHVACKKSVESGPQPTSSCVNHFCVNDPYTVAYWKRLPYRGGFVSERINSCLRTAGIDPTWQTQQVYAAIRDSEYKYLDTIDGLIQKNTFPADKPLVEVVESAISCDDVVAKVKALKKQ